MTFDQQQHQSHNAMNHQQDANLFSGQQKAFQNNVFPYNVDAPIKMRADGKIRQQPQSMTSQQQQQNLQHKSIRGHQQHIQSRLQQDRQQQDRMESLQKQIYMLQQQRQQQHQHQHQQQQQ